MHVAGFEILIVHNFMKVRVQNEYKNFVPIHYDDFTHYETSKDEIESHGLKVFNQGEWIALL